MKISTIPPPQRGPLINRARKIPLKLIPTFGDFLSASRWTTPRDNGSGVGGSDAKPKPRWRERQERCWERWERCRERRERRLRPFQPVRHPLPERPFWKRERRRRPISAPLGTLAAAPIVLLVAAFALTAAGVVINGSFARSLGSTDTAGWLFLAVGVPLIALRSSCPPALPGSGRRASGQRHWSAG
jgi:hypothetical protein